MSSLAASPERDGSSTLVRILAWLPSPTFVFAGAVALVLFAVTLGKGVQDPDYFWHVTTGELIARTGQVPSVDPFSFTWAGRPWTPHEWLSEILIYWVVSGLSRVGALMIFAALAGGIWLVMASALERRGLRVLPIGLACALGALVLAPYVTLRPQIASWLLMAALVWLLLELRADQTRLAWALPPFFLIWANLHGLWVVGLGVLGIYTLFTLAGHTPMAPFRGRMLAIALLALLATMATPAGPVGVLYPLRYIESGDWGLANIEEWQSPNFHEPAHLGLLLMVMLMIVNGGRGAPAWLHATSIVTTVMALIALRNAPVAAVTATPVLAMGLEAWLARRPRDSHVRRPSVAMGRRLMEISVALAIVVAAFVIIVPRSLSEGIDENIDKRFPVQGVAVLARLDPDARVLAEYGWGGYVIAALYDQGGRVFVDGRNDMYDQAVLEDYSAIRAADDGWKQLAHDYRVEALLFPPDIPLMRGQAADAGWCEAYRDANEVLLLRSCSGMAL